MAFNQSNANVFFFCFERKIYEKRCAFLLFLVHKSRATRLPAEVADGFRWKVEVETPGAPADLVHATITVTWGADANGEAPAGSRTAVRWFYRPPAAAPGGVTRGPNLGGGR